MVFVLSLGAGGKQDGKLQDGVWKANQSLHTIILSPPPDIEYLPNRAFIYCCFFFLGGVCIISMTGLVCLLDGGGRPQVPVPGVLKTCCSSYVL